MSMNISTEKNAADSRLILIILFGFILFYMPLFFKSTATAIIHDNLQSEVVMNKIIGEWYRGNSGAEKLALNGNIPVWALPRFFQPLVLLYTIKDAWIAYLINDLIVRLVAFIGVIGLAQHLKVKSSLSVLGAACFSASLSYTTYGFSVAGMPMILWIINSISTATPRIKFLYFLIIFFISLNISLALSGIFLILFLVPLLIITNDCQSRSISKAGIATVILGLLCGNANLLYAQLSGIEWHRIEYQPLIDSGLNLKSQLLTSLATSIGAYHTGTRLVFLLISGLLVFFHDQKELNKGLSILALIVFVGLFYFINNLPDVQIMKFKAGGLLTTLQIDRFYFISPTLVIIFWLLACKSKINYVTSFMLFCGLLQLCAVILYSPQFSNLISRIGIKIENQSSSTFSDYYRYEYFNRIRSIINGKAVVSVGFDPMVAPMNGIPSIDGYYNFYPLAYKHEFMKVINTSLEESHLTDYFQKWGNRVYTFHDSRKPESIDFCAARHLGANYVISINRINSPQLLLLDADYSVHSLLYEIKCDM